MLRSYDVIVNVEYEVYGEVNDKQISEWLDGLVFSDLILNEYNVVKIADVDVRVFPYFNICNDFIINISLDYFRGELRMSELVGIKIKGFEVEYIKDNIYYLKQIDNELNHVSINMTSKKVINSRINGRNYKSERFLKKYNFLVELLDYTIKLDSIYNSSIEVKPQKVFKRPFDIVQNIFECGRI